MAESNELLRAKDVVGFKDPQLRQMTPGCLAQSGPILPYRELGLFTARDQIQLLSIPTSNCHSQRRGREDVGVPSMAMETDNGGLNEV